MSSFNCIVELAGITICYALRYKDTIKYLGKYVKESALCEELPVSVKDYEFEDWKQLGNEVNAYGEYSLLSLQTSEAMFEHQRFVFHSVALRWHDKAWLLTAPPGVGKSTQYKNLKELYEDEVSIINGDRPIIQIMENGSIMVHPSPWNGKEEWQGAEAAPLAGIICLKQGQENAIKSLTAKESAVSVLASVFHSYENEQIVRKASKLATAMLKPTPVWLLTNKGDLASSALLHDTLVEWERRQENAV